MSPSLASCDVGGPSVGAADRVPRHPAYRLDVDSDGAGRWLVLFAPVVAADYPPGADAVVREAAREAERRRSEDLTAVAGAVERERDSWVAYRAHRGASGGMRRVRVYWTADVAVAEVVRLDRAYRERLGVRPPRVRPAGGPRRSGDPLGRRRAGRRRGQ